MKLSACYIVKDEAGALRRSLQSIREAVDACTLVNTIADSAIRALARRYHADYVCHAWQDDFAEARNFALSRVPADTDWLLFLDADEYLPGNTARSLRTLLGQQPADVDGLCLKLYNIEHNGTVLSSFYALRLFRYRPELAYTGRIHEQPALAGRALRLARLPEQKLYLYHTGYAAEENHAKAQRNLRMLQQAVREGEAAGPLYGYLAETYEGLGECEQALHYAKLAIARGRQPGTFASRAWRVALRLAAGTEKHELCASAVQSFPELPEFHAEYAVSLAQQADYPEALRELQLALQGRGAQTGMETSEFDEEMVQTADHLAEDWQAKLALAARLRLAACVICRDEEAELPVWLRQMRELGAMLFVVDTGSRDKTRELAKAAGARVTDFPWQDDFAAAKNAALRQVPAGTDWILFLDADEQFTQESLRRLRCVLAREQAASERQAILCRIINIDADDEDKEIDRFVNVRIFRAGAGLRYAGRVHEQLCTPAGDTPKLLNAENELIIHHTGYSSQRIQQKLRRNLVLLQQEIALHGEQPAHYAQLVDCYFGLGDYEKAIHYARKHIQAGIVCIGREDNIYDRLIRAEYMYGEAEKRILADMQEYRHRYPGSETLMVLEQDIQKYKKKQADTQEEINMTENTIYDRSAEAKPDDNDAAVVSSNDELKEMERQQRQKTSAAIPIDMEAIQQQVLAGDFSSGYQKSSLAIGARIQELLASLLMPGVLEQLEQKNKLGRIWNVLTEPMKRIVQRYFDGIRVFLPIDYSTYWAFFPAILRFCPQSVIHRYVECGLDFSETNQLYRMALQLKDSFCYPDAAFVLDELFAVEDNAAEGIYLSAGVVYYGAGRLDDAEKCFNHLEGNEAIEGQIAAYKTWISERKRENW